MEDNGLEYPPKTRGKTQVGESAARIPARSNLDRHENTEELVDIWNRLDEAGKADLLAVARGLAAKAAKAVQP